MHAGEGESSINWLERRSFRSLNDDNDGISRSPPAPFPSGGCARSRRPSASASRAGRVSHDITSKENNHPTRMNPGGEVDFRRGNELIVARDPLAQGEGKTLLEQVTLTVSALL